MTNSERMTHKNGNNEENLRNVLEKVRGLNANDISGNVYVKITVRSKGLATSNEIFK